MLTKRRKVCQYASFKSYDWGSGPPAPATGRCQNYSLCLSAGRTASAYRHTKVRSRQADAGHAVISVLAEEPVDLTSDVSRR